MNKTRRSEINRIATRMRSLVSELNDCLSEEQDYYDNIPENLQYSSRAEDSEEYIETMENCIDQIGEALDDLESI